MQRNREIPAGCRTNQHDLKANARCFTLVSVIAEGWSDGLTMLDWFTVHEAILSAYMRESVYVRSHVGYGRMHQTLLLHVPQIFQRRKSDANKQDFKIKLNFDLTHQIQSTPKIIGILTKEFCTSGPNLVILAWTGGELSRGQAQNGVTFDFQVTPVWIHRWLWNNAQSFV